MSVKSRLGKAQAASKNVVVTLPGKWQTAYGQRSLSDPTTNYQQRIKWTGKSKIEDVEFLTVECQCNKVAGAQMEQPNCEGNQRTICYHCLAALIFAACQKQKQLTLFDDFSSAVNYSNLGGQLIKVESAQGGKHCWAVSKDKRMNLKQRVNLMRGPVEEGID